MSKDLKKLDKQFRKRIKKVLDAYKPEGIIMKPYWHYKNSGKAS